MSKKIVLFGASSRTSKPLLQQMLEKGYTITALARNITELQKGYGSNSNVKIIPFDVFKPENTKLEDLQAALQDADFVVSSLGSPKNESTTITETGLKFVMESMKKYANKTKRLAIISSAGCNPSDPSLGFFFRTMVLKVFTYHMHQDLNNMEKEVKTNGSDLEYTLIHPPQLTDTGLTKVYRVNKDVLPKNAAKISRADLAHFIIENLIEKNEFVREIACVGY